MSVSMRSTLITGMVLYNFHGRNVRVQSIWILDMLCLGEPELPRFIVNWGAYKQGRLGQINHRRVYFATISNVI